MHYTKVFFKHRYTLHCITGFSQLDIFCLISIEEHFCYLMRDSYSGYIFLEGGDVYGDLYVDNKNSSTCLWNTWPEEISGTCLDETSGTCWTFICVSRLINTLVSALMRFAGLLLWDSDGQRMTFGAMRSFDRPCWQTLYTTLIGTSISSYHSSPCQMSVPFLIC